MRKKYYLIILIFLMSSLHIKIYSQQENPVQKYLSENKLRLSVGYLIIDKREKSEYLTFSNNKTIYNISYKFLDFSKKDQYPQIGLTNELGIKNTLAFFKVGPQLLIIPNFSIDLHIGLGIIFNKSFIIRPFSATIFCGFTPTYSLDLSEKLRFEVEGGIDSSIEDQFALSTYIMIGFSYRTSK
ncbi:hypothetical protein C0389_04405 [bacterium]|nr:hypothetical protein [bacterium]